MLAPPAQRSEERRGPRTRQEPVTMRAIEEAVADMARRQNTNATERQNQDKMPAPWVLKDEIAHLAQRIEETRAEFSQTNLTSSIEQRIDQLATRIDEVMKEIASHIGTPKHDLASLQALQTQIAQLSERIERSDLSADGVHTLQRTVVDLFRYVEDMRSAALEQAKRSEQQAQDLHVLRSLDEHLTALNERVGKADVTAEGLAAVETTLAELFRHVEDTRRAALDASAKADAWAQNETQLLAAVQHQMQQLAERVQRTEHHVSALGSIEQGMSALFQEFRSSQATAAEVAQQAVKQALSQQFGENGGRLHADIDDLRKHQNASEQRTHVALTSMHQTLDKVVDRIASMEEVGAPHERLPAPPPREPHVTAAPATPVSHLTPQRGNEIVPGETLAPLIAVDPADHGALLEPDSDGSETAPALSSGVHNDQANYISAVRKANHKPLPRMTMTMAEEAPPARAGSIGKLRSLLSARKLLIAATGFIALIGAEQALQPGLPLPKASSLQPIVRSPEVAIPALPKSRASLTAPDQTASIAPSAPSQPPAAGPANEQIGSLGAASEEQKSNSAQSKSLPLNVLKDAAQNGVAAAQFELAERLMEGRGVGKDVFAAAMWYEKAALQNLPPAQYMIGTSYEKGLGVAKDVRRARDWYQRAADLGHVRAMHNLASLYAEGVDGKPDYSTAAIWFRRAAEYGVRDSQYNLAILYGRGLGTELSLPQSYAWFALAALQGDEEAARKRDDIAARLDQKQLTAGKTFIATFRARVPDVASNDVVPQGGWDALKADSKLGKPKTARATN
jgi:localization factor PodJL